MYKSSFVSLGQEVLTELVNIKNTQPEIFKRYERSDEFEELICTIVQKKIKGMPNKPHIDYKSGSHRFPDIVLKYPNNQKFGFEVKSSTSKGPAWRTNGNSILGTTRDDDVEEIHIIFGKVSQENLGFRLKEYSEAVSTISVTHSPRYILDMDLKKDENFFCKSGITFSQLSESNDPIGKISSYFAGEGKRAWWIAETAPPVIRVLNDLSAKDKNKILGYGMAHFPEVFASSYYNFAAWLTATKSIVSYNLRDFFTAGGRVSYVIEHRTYENLPAVFGNLKACIEDVVNALKLATPEELSLDWNIDINFDNTLNSKLLNWKTMVLPYIKKQDFGNNEDNVEQIIDSLIEDYLK